MNNVKWYQQCGEQGDVVLSTRIRLARNLQHLPFPSMMSGAQKREMAERIFALLAQREGEPFSHIYTDSLTEAQAMSMVERHLISPEFARRGEGEALILSADESVSIMVCEEDHLRIQVMRAGFDLDGAYHEADCFDTYLDSQLHFAFDARLGYLTQCPSNLGTGMRASLMLHLPALQEKGIVQQLAATVSKLGLTIRGLYGEGSDSKGAIYQLSNQVTLGITESEAIENLKGIAEQIIKEELSCRESLSQTPAAQDRLFRSLGILKHARLLSGKESMTLLSQVRMGVSLGLIDTLTLEDVSALLVDIQPATLMLKEGRAMEPSERDALRAKTVRERLKGE